MQIVQVCWELTRENEEREVNRLLAAMEYFKTENSVIVTAASSDTVRTNAGFISVVPAHQYLLR
jgi:hypothetical protein